MKRYSTLLTLFILLAMPVLAQEPPGESPLPPLDMEIAVTDWYVVGPFLSGSREPLVDPLGDSFDRDTGTVDLTATYPSVQAYGGSVSWQPTTVDSEDNLTVNFDQPDWDKIMDEWGAAGIYFSAAAYSTFQCDKTCRALIDANGLGGFYINGRIYTGDPYGHSLIRTPVILDQGENRVLLFLGGAGGSDSVQFKIAPTESDVMILDHDMLLPDLIRGESVSSPAGIPIVNSTDLWMKNLTIDIGGEAPIAATSVIVPELAPLSVIKVPIDFRTDGPLPESWEAATVDVPILVRWTGGEVRIISPANVRNASDSRRVTFLSGIDGSAQKYGMIYPVNYDPSRKYSLIFALHGAGVECEGLVDAFEPKDWAFIVAPTNRRSFGFDWQDWGRLDALEILDLAMQRYPIDPNRVYLVGHSMGGHGAWLFGCTYADRFAAIVPSAGWASFQLYTPWFLRTDDMIADPQLARIFDATTSPDRVERLLPNLRNTSLLAVTGGNDDNVPPTHSRLLVGMLRRMGYDARLWEEPGQGHWWDLHPDIPGADCVDGLRIRSFLREHVRNPFPSHVTLVSYDLGNNNKMYWVRVDEEINPIGLVQVDAELDGSVLTCTTQNAKQITFDFGNGFPYGAPSRIMIDGNLVSDVVPDSSGLVTLTKSDDGWRMGTDSPSFLNRTPNFRGPMKRAYFSPFILVVGTIGPPELNQYNLELARTTAQRWWYRANGYTQIIRDLDMPWEIAADHNLILIGGPFANGWSTGFCENGYLDSIPLAIDDTGVRIGSEFIAGEDLACKFVYPNPLNPERLILAEWATWDSLDGMRLAGGLNCMYSGSGLPDFLVYDKSVRLTGYAGVYAAGFFDNNWKLNPEFYYIRSSSQSSPTNPWVP